MHPTRRATLTGSLAAPFAANAAIDPPPWLAALPPALWIGLPALPLAAGMIGFATAQGTVRRWLRRLP